MTMAPFSVAASMARRCPACSGVSRSMSTTRRRSVSCTSAAGGGGGGGVVGAGVADVGERADRAGRNDHAARLERARRHGGADVAVGIGFGGERARLLNRGVAFLLERLHRRLGDDEVRWHAD